MAFGQVVGEVPRTNLEDIPRSERLIVVYCDGHAGASRRKVAVVVRNKGQVWTSSGPTDWVRPGSDSVLAPCCRCIGRNAERALSVKKLRAAVRAGRTSVSLREVLAGDLPGQTLSS